MPVLAEFLVNRAMCMIGFFKGKSGRGVDASNWREGIPSRLARWIPLYTVVGQSTLSGHLRPGSLSSLYHDQVYHHTTRLFDLNLPFSLLLVGDLQVAVGGQSDARGIGRPNLGPAKLLTNCTRVCWLRSYINAIC